MTHLRSSLTPPALLTAATLGLIALTGCYDFAGDRERVGFVTDATIDGRTAWTPDTPLAEGSVLHLEVGEILKTEREPEGPANFEGSRHLTLTPHDQGVHVEAGARRGWVQVEVDGVRDDFRIQWAQPDIGYLVDPIDQLLVEAGALDPEFDAMVEGLTVVEGGSVELGYVLHDRRGAELGYTPRQLQLTSDAPEIAHLTAEEGERALVLTGGRAGGTTIDVAWPGLPGTRIPVDVVSTGQIDGLVVEELEVAGECVVHAMLTSHDARVAGASGFAWTHDDTDEAWAPCPAEDEPADVHWGRWTTAI